jgi:hypothetical protein
MKGTSVSGQPDLVKDSTTFASWPPILRTTGTGYSDCGNQRYMTPFKINANRTRRLLDCSSTACLLSV